MRAVLKFQNKDKLFLVKALNFIISLNQTRLLPLIDDFVVPAESQ